METEERRRSEKGSYGTEYPSQDFVEAIRSIKKTATTGKIAECVGCAQNTAWVTLSDMEEDGVVCSEDLGNNTAWHLTGENLPEEGSA
jgi:hypothetical protein